MAKIETPNYNLQQATADENHPQDFSSLSRAEARMPGDNPPMIEKTSVTDRILNAKKFAEREAS